MTPAAHQATARQRGTGWDGTASARCLADGTLVPFVAAPIDSLGVGPHGSVSDTIVPALTLRFMQSVPEKRCTLNVLSRQVDRC